MSEVANLTAVPGEPADEVVEFLEGLLESAKAGDLRSIAVVSADKGNRVTTGWSGQPNMVMATLGGLRTLERDFMEEFVE